ncbi:cell wall metabolism sensor histidine kinase WalK [Virgibacillus halodenitrificans]|uniref:histidine kinase n=1 Tax=Virgibacillus halodenitrificans TaxID=1482 RepID=A0AAC9NMZ1_VIRHA|nr:cell wall metabolism sensor histidine kinase WalK [Virgibacillus halodenitrificans]APC50109.1 cell wall metabolism sensor histidine kinase WalK [Virgibacillus halodenitrificans]MBD1222332.1 cell wall metabolism sensor histidine kinase WalK [Virgibacillus halodenitrificans]MCG1027581.1 cell wall metabolism sensor histidine kinase WalK [Virgibacillus halodenitrificans]MCJ0931551.1 cell wall metabolism sensor histidine kinase WalK [Virgibacillus halodenitrificans]MYL59397.1 cell wall metabolis
MNKVGFFRSIQLKFIIIYILLLLVAIQVIGSFFTNELEAELRENFFTSINDRVQLLSYNLEQAFNRERMEDGEGPTLQQEVQSIISDVGPDDITSLQVINNQSRIIATNDYSSQGDIGKKTTRDMVQQALVTDSVQSGEMFDQATRQQVFVLAQPILDSDGVAVGVIYLKASMEGVNEQLQNINEIFLKGSILAVTVSAFIGILVARTITKPIIEMRRQAQTMARGDFTQKVNVYGRDEIGHLAETFNDLNSRLKHSYATIEEERRKLSSVLSNMSDGVIATDNVGAVTLMNEAAGRLIGHNPDEIIGENLLDIFQLEEKIVDITELHDSGSIIIDLSTEEQESLVRANFSTVLDDEDELTGFITVISDVTEQEKIEQERRDFVSNVSHELRTPLTTMRSYIEALTDGAWEDKEIAPKFLGVAQNETERMIRMVNDLLQLSKMDAKEHPLKKERTEFINYFHGIIDRFEMNVPEHISLKRELPKGKFNVWLDQDKMTQVLDNIISNAIKYSPEGGKITLRVENRRHHILVSIQDEGMGIAYDKLEKIFERFYRADKARTRKLGGTGLGLAIAKELVEAHHGKIWAKSKEGKGTAILFTLPLMNQKRRGL